MSVLIPLTWPFLIGLTVDVVPDRVSLFELVLQAAGIGALAGVAIARASGVPGGSRDGYVEVGTLIGALMGLLAFAVVAIQQALS